MKICFITDNVFSLGGIQRVVSVLSSELSKEYDVSILCTDKHSKENRTMYNLDEKVTVITRPELIQKSFFTKIFTKLPKIMNDKIGILNCRRTIKILTKTYFPKEIQEKFVNYLNKNKYDIIIGVAGYYSLLLGIISNKLNSKTIGWQHSSYDAYLKTYNKYHWNQEQLFKEHIKKLNKYIVLTELDKFKVDKEFNIKSKRIYNPISFISHNKSNCTKKNIIYVGRLICETKGLDLLLKAFKKVSLKYNDWNLYIIGDGPDKNKVNMLIKDLNLSQQAFIKGFTSNIKQCYLNSSIFVSSSRWEGFGLVITEAMECGLPVVAFANSGPKEIINKDNINGILVECEDVNKLSESIISLIENEEKRKIISRESIKRAKDFNVEIIAKEWKKIFEI